MYEYRSIHNTQFKKHTKLQQKKYRDMYNAYCLEGEHSVIEALRHTASLIECFYVLEGTSLACYEEIRATNQLHIPCFSISKEALKKLSLLPSPPTVIAIMKKVDETTFEIKLENSQRILCLYDIQDPGNAGTLIRSAVAFGYDAVLFSGNSVDRYHPKVLRSTQGLEFYIPVYERVSLHDDRLKEHHFIGTTLTGIPLKDYQLPKQKAHLLILGNEGNGLPQDIQQNVDDHVTIEMQPCVESLNVGVAGALCMYHFGG